MRARGVWALALLLLIGGAGGAASGQEMQLPLEQARELKASLERAARDWDAAAASIEVQGRALNDDDFERIGHFRRGAEQIRQAAALLADRIARGDVRLRGDEVRLLRHAKELAEGGPERYPGPSKVPGRPPVIDLERELRGDRLEAGEQEAPQPATAPANAVQRRLARERERRELRRRARRLALEVRLRQIEARLHEIELERIKLRLEAMEIEDKLQRGEGGAALRTWGPKVAPTRPLWVLEQVFTGPPRDWDAIHEALVRAAKEHGLEITGPVIHRYEHVGGPGDEKWVTRIALGVQGEDLSPWATKSVALRRLGARKALQVKVEGPYERAFGEVGQKLRREVHRRGFEPAGPLEIWYFDDPRNAPEDEQSSLVLIPVR